MKYVTDELQKSLKYHLRQLEENLQKISTYEETINDLKSRNERHREAIEELGEYIEQLKGE